MALTPWHLAWNPASPLLASCSTDKSLRLYSYAPNPDPGPAAPPYRFSLQSTIPNCHPRTVRSLEFSPTGATLATASFDATVGVWCQVSEAGLDDGGGGNEHAGGGGGEWEPVDPLEGHESECKSVAWSADGRLLASCSRDKSVWVWEAVGPADFECLAVLMEHSQDVKCVTWHPTDELLASASYDDTIKLYAADPYDDEWQCIHTLTAHSGTVWSLSFSPCGRYLASAGDDLVIKLWERVSLLDLEEGEQNQKDLGQLGEAKRVEGGRMGPWSAGGVRIGMKEKWRWEERGEIRDAHERTIYAIDWKAGGASEGGLGRIVSAGGDGRINVFQMLEPSLEEEGAPVTTNPNAAAAAAEEEDPETPAPSSSSSAIAGEKKKNKNKNKDPRHVLVAQIEDAHGVSDVNHVAWCTLSPALAAAKLRALEGGEDDPDQEQESTGGGAARREEEDPRWKKTRDMFASAGDDGLVKVWVVDP
ncbi:hypothetical protein B0A53_05763 [Rhodotorula sp. CCFEE 5036]|nr:hypothetical protein B0A53_05763 [Rhodotorula sp. CCFEE 5036]